MIDVDVFSKPDSLIIHTLTPFCPQLRSCSRSRTWRRWKRWSRRYRGSVLASNTGYPRLGKRDNCLERKEALLLCSKERKDLGIYFQTCSSHSPVSLSLSERRFQGRIRSASFYTDIFIISNIYSDYKSNKQKMRICFNY
jgi:hypothetical protein